MKREYFFVYGSLKRGYWNNILLTNCVFEGEGVTLEPFLMLDGVFPYVFRHQRFTLPVKGEVWSSDNPQVVERLDRLEGVKSDHYKRELVKVDVKGITYSCFIYLATKQTVDELDHARHPVASNEGGYYEWS